MPPLSGPVKRRRAGEGQAGKAGETGGVVNRQRIGQRHGRSAELFTRLMRPPVSLPSVTVPVPKGPG